MTKPKEPKGSEVFYKAEALFHDMSDNLVELMLAEVKEHGTEMAINMVAGNPAFSDSTLAYAEKLKEVGEVMAFLDGFRFGNFVSFNVESLSEIEHLANLAKKDSGSGKKIQAIKLLRAAVNGLNLKEAKVAVEDFMQNGKWSEEFMLRCRRGC